jgi:DNA polymerase-1
MSHVLEPHMSRALKNQATRHVDPTAYAGQKHLDDAMTASGWTWETIPTDFPWFWRYGALDPVLTYQLRQHHEPLVEQQGASYAYELETAYQWVAMDMMTNGVHVDIPHVEKYLQEFRDYCVSVEKWVKQEYGITPGSNQKVIEILQRAGVQFDKQTEKGALSLDKDVLEGIDHPLARAVLTRRQLQKMASTYLRFYAEHVDGDSLIHPSINTLGTRTGRCSMSEPNFQNLPVRGGGPGVKVVRNGVTARPGNTLVFCDFDQVEMRGLAILSGDEGLRAAFHAPEDFFVTVARQIFQDPHLIKSDPRRAPTKNAMYAKVYGAGIAKQAATAGVAYEQMLFINQQLDTAYPKIEGYIKYVYNVGMQQGYVQCPLTGRRHYADPGKEYALINYLIQGWAAAMFKQKQLELHAAGLGPYMILPVHDEIILDIPTELVPDAAQTLRAIMNDTSYPVPITASVAYGPRWGQKEEWVY